MRHWRMTSPDPLTLLSERFVAVVRQLVELLPVDEINWALTGSVAHKLAGAEVRLGEDIDIQTDVAGAYQVQERLPSRAVVEPIHLRESERIRSHFGRALVDGVPVEIMGGLQKRREPSDDWNDPVNPADHRQLVRLGEVLVPVLSLAHEAEAYDLLGRYDRAAALRRAAGAPQLEDQAAPSRSDGPVVTSGDDLTCGAPTHGGAA